MFSKFYVIAFPWLYSCSQSVLYKTFWKRKKNSWIYAWSCSQLFGLQWLLFSILQGWKKQLWCYVFYWFFIAKMTAEMSNIVRLICFKSWITFVSIKYWFFTKHVIVQRLLCNVCLSYIPKMVKHETTRSEWRWMTKYHLHFSMTIFRISY